MSCWGQDESYAAGIATEVPVSPAWLSHHPHARLFSNEQICRASGLDIGLFRDSPEDNLSALLVAWYTEHRARGGAPDAVQEQLLAEVEAEDTLGAHRVQIGSGRPQ